MGIPTLRPCYFEAREDTMTKYKLQTLHVIRIKYWKTGGSGNPPSLISALWNRHFYYGQCNSLAVSLKLHGPIYSNTIAAAAESLSIATECARIQKAHGSNTEL